MKTLFNILAILFVLIAITLHLTGEATANLYGALINLCLWLTLVCSVLDRMWEE